MLTVKNMLLPVASLFPGIFRVLLYPHPSSGFVVQHFLPQWLNKWISFYILWVFSSSSLLAFKVFEVSIVQIHFSLLIFTIFWVWEVLYFININNIDNTKGVSSHYFVYFVLLLFSQLLYFSACYLKNKLKNLLFLIINHLCLTHLAVSYNILTWMFIII